MDEHPGHDDTRRVPSEPALLPPGKRQRVSAYGILEDDGGRILLVRAAAYLTVAGDWFLPGGGIDHGEAPEQTLVRELAEETGLAVEVGPLLGALTDLITLPDGDLLHTVRLVYRIATWSGRVRAEVGGSSDLASWFPLAEARTLPLLPYVRRALVELEPLGRPATGS